MQQKKIPNLLHHYQVANLIATHKSANKPVEKEKDPKKFDDEAEIDVDMVVSAQTQFTKTVYTPHEKVDAFKRETYAGMDMFKEEQVGRFGVVFASVPLIPRMI